jgi:hypothetical protein
MVKNTLDLSYRYNADVVDMQEFFDFSSEIFTRYQGQGGISLSACSLCTLVTPA